MPKKPRRRREGKGAGIWFTNSDDHTAAVRAAYSIGLSFNEFAIRSIQNAVDDLESSSADADAISRVEEIRERFGVFDPDRPRRGATSPAARDRPPIRRRTVKPGE